MKTSHHHELSADCFRYGAADGILDEDKASNTIQKLNTYPSGCVRALLFSERPTLMA